MVSLKLHTVAAIAALLMTSTAYAVTVTNRGDKEVKLTVIEGEGRQEKIVLAGKVIEGVCQKGCIIRLNDSEKDEYELTGSETVSVEEGVLYYDGEEVVGAPVDGSTGSQSRKGSK